MDPMVKDRMAQITADDRAVIGNPTPKFTYGGAVNLTYKGISLSVDVGGVYGNQVFRVWGSLESPFQRVNYAAYQVGSVEWPRYFKLGTNCKPGRQV